MVGDMGLINTRAVYKGDFWYLFHDLFARF